MSNYPADQVLSPPDLPPYLESVCKLEPIVGVPIDDQVIGIHTVIRVANKVVDERRRSRASQSPLRTLVRCSNGQVLYMFDGLDHPAKCSVAKYRSKYPCSIFPMNLTYTPPTLPVHISVHLESISGQPSQEQVTNVQNAIRSYQKLTDAPSLFDPQVNAELSQHLFDIQMGVFNFERCLGIWLDFRVARYIHRCGGATPAPQGTITVDPPFVTPATEQASRETNTSVNNAGRGSDVVEPCQFTQLSLDLKDTIERSNQIAERANQLAERSNQIIERSNQISNQLSQAIERHSPPVDQSTNLVEKLTEFLGRINERCDQSSHPINAAMKPIEKLGDTLKNINKVLVGIQHAIIRNHKGNTVHAINCLVNEKGETFVVSGAVTFSEISRFFVSHSDTLLPVVVDGASQNFHIPDMWIERLLRFYDIGGKFWQDAKKMKLKEGYEDIARQTLCSYLSSYVG